MEKVKFKNKYKEIKEGYLLPIQGEFEGWYDGIAMIAMPEEEFGMCPCIVFAKPRNGCSKYQYVEDASIPYINLYSKNDVANLLKAYEVCKYKKNRK